MTEKSRLDHLALHFVPGIGSVMIRQLISHFGDATAVWQASKRELMAVRGFGPITYALLRKSGDFHSKAEACMASVVRNHISLLLHSEPEFPERRKHIPDAPSLLYYKGSANLNHSRVIAIVGTRSSSNYGRQFTIKLLHELKKYNPIIVSGLAYGIDITAHRESIHAGLSTIAVMAGGLDRIYPSDHRKEVETMVSRGGIITEHPPGTTPEAHNFPSRNRIIAGMSDAVVVVEAGKKGGAQITARLANEYNREVFALPGPYHSLVSEGCNQLIKTHQANLISTADDIAYLLNWQKKEPQKPVRHGLSISERRLVTVLEEHPDGLHIDQLCWISNLTIHEAAIALVNLECHRIIKGLPGSRYILRA